MYFDLNMNGTFDVGEPGVDGAEIELRDATGTGLIQGPRPPAMQTGPGAFTFTGVAPGNYKVVESDSLDAVRTPAEPISISVGGAPVTGVNFGIVLKRSVTGRVYHGLGYAAQRL